MTLEESNLSRRSFLKSVGIVAAGTGVASLGLTSCASEEGVAEEKKTTAAGFSYQEPNETVEADVIVVGSGMGGLSAALSASDQGAKVVLIEANDMLGGATNHAEGMFGAGTKMQEELGITDLNPKEIINIEYNFQNYTVDPKLWELVANQSAENIEWLIDKGVVFDTVTGMGDTALCWHVFEGWQGVSLVGYLSDALDKQGVAVHTNTRGTTLITEDGSVVGIQAQTADGYTDFKGSVILACGGFSANKEYVDEYSNFEPGRYKDFGVASAQGDALRMVGEITGERPKNTTICVVGSSLPDLPPTAQLSVCGAMETTNLWVNDLGERYVSESITRQPSVSGNVLLSQNRKTFSLFDQKAYDRFTSEGLGTGYGMFVPPGTVCDQLDAEMEQHKDSEYWWKADSIEELAEKMGVEVAALTTTVERYNEFCETGVDEDYEKPADMLIAIDRAPFYGFEIQPVVLFTMGGIRIDRDCRVCDKSMKPIPGLYGASVDVSGFQGQTYGIIVSGSAQAIACWSGRVAAKTAVSEA